MRFGLPVVNARGTLDDISKYMFSDDSGPYQAPTYEKLLINTMNMLNYLSRGNLNGAKIAGPTVLARKAPGKAPRPKVIVANIDRVLIVERT